MFGFHLEKVGKIRTKCQLQCNTDLLASIVHDVKVFVDATFNRPFDRQADGICLNIALFCIDFGIGEICPFVTLQMARGGCEVAGTVKDQILIGYLTSSGAQTRVTNLDMIVLIVSYNMGNFLPRCG